MVHFRSRGIGLEQCIQLMKNSRNGTIWFHGEREKNTKLFFYHYLIDSNKHITLGICMLTYSTRKQIGNALVKLSGVDYHFELRNDKWVQTNNSHLTNMEKVIIGQSANGKSIANIAEYLSVSITTIKTHRTNIFKKLGVSNITEAIQYVEDYNLI